MGRLQRQTVTVHSTLLRWRKLYPDQLSISGTCTTSGKYIPYIQLVELDYYPASRDRWPDHYLGKDDMGNYYQLPLVEEEFSIGPKI